jgi:hypothetical protein
MRTVYRAASGHEIWQAQRFSFGSEPSIALKTIATALNVQECTQKLFLLPMVWRTAPGKVARVRDQEVQRERRGELVRGVRDVRQTSGQLSALAPAPPRAQGLDPYIRTIQSTI